MVTERGDRIKKITTGKKRLECPLMYYFKRIDAVAWTNINLSRHQAQEQLQRGMGVNLRDADNACVTDGFLCLHFILRRGAKKKKQFRQLSSKLSDWGNFYPLAFCRSPLPIFYPSLSM